MRPYKQADLTHYRDRHQTYLDCDWIESDLTELGSDAQYLWIRLISGPENCDLSVDVADMVNLGKRNLPGSLIHNLQELRAIGAIDVHAGLITFPNLTAGCPPDWDEASEPGPLT